MAVQVTIKKFLEIIERQFVSENKNPLFGIGKGGIGKTEGVHGLTKKLGIGFKEIRLLLYSEVDLVGIPIIDPKTGETTWARNSLFPIAERDGEKGILVLDEITSASQNIRTAAYQLLDSKRSLGNYKLPDGWLVVGLGNGEEDGGSFQGYEGNLGNRGKIYNVVPDVDAWKSWASNNDVNPAIIAFLSFMPDMIHTYNVDNSIEQFASPRSWVALSKELNYNEKIGQPFDPKDELLFLLAAGCVGDNAANKFIAFYDYKKSMINPEDILAGKIRNSTELEQQVIHMTLQSTIRLYKQHFDVAASKSQLEGSIVKETANLLNWIIGLKDIRLDYAVLGISDLTKTCPNIANIVIRPSFSDACPGFDTFCAENAVVYN